MFNGDWSSLPRKTRSDQTQSSDMETDDNLMPPPDEVVTELSSRGPQRNGSRNRLMMLHGLYVHRPVLVRHCQAQREDPFRRRMLVRFKGVPDVELWMICHHHLRGRGTCFDAECSLRLRYWHASVLWFSVFELYLPLLGPELRLICLYSHRIRLCHILLYNRLRLH